jgi:hypothetical protein
LSDRHLYGRTKEVWQQFDPKLNQPDGAIYLVGNRFSYYMMMVSATNNYSSFS